MPQHSSDRLQIRNTPWGLWAALSVFVVIGLLAVFLDGKWVGLILAGGGLLAIVFLTEITSLTAERGRGMVTLTSWTFLRGTECREIPSCDITEVAIEHSPSTGSGGQTFRVALVLTSGEQVPLTNYYSGTRGDKAEAARRLSDFLGKDRASAVPVVDNASNCQEQTGSTAGVDWRLETWHSADGNACTRWFASTGGYANGLLILFQIDRGVGRLPWNAGPLAAISKFGYKSQLLEYHFQMADLDAVDTVDPLHDLDLRLQDCYLALATYPETALQWLNPARVEALADWAAAHPAPAVQWRNDGVLGGALILAAPAGLWLVFRGSTQDPDCMAEVAGLGAALAAAPAETSS